MVTWDGPTERLEVVLRVTAISTTLARVGRHPQFSWLYMLDQCLFPIY
jgi:hypothetical protein